MAIVNQTLYIIIASTTGDWTKLQRDFYKKYGWDAYIVVCLQDIFNLVATPSLDPNDIMGWIHPSAKQNHKELAEIIKFIYSYKKRRNNRLAEDFFYKMSQAGLIKI